MRSHVAGQFYQRGLRVMFKASLAGLGGPRSPNSSQQAENAKTSTFSIKIRPHFVPNLLHLLNLWRMGKRSVDCKKSHEVGNHFGIE